MTIDNINGHTNIRATKAEIIEAFYLYLDKTLPNLDCELVKQRGNFMCHRCDDCMYQQMLYWVKHGEKSKKTKELKGK